MQVVGSLILAALAAVAYWHSGLAGAFGSHHSAPVVLAEQAEQQTFLEKEQAKQPTAAYLAAEDEEAQSTSSSAAEEQTFLAKEPAEQPTAARW